MTTPKTFLQPIEKLSTGKIGNSEGYSWVKGQILRGNLLVVSMSMNECDYESYGIVRYVVYATKLTLHTPNFSPTSDTEYTRGNIVKNTGKDAFVEDSQGAYIKTFTMFSLFSLIINGSTTILCEHEIPVDEPIETNFQ